MHLKQMMPKTQNHQPLNWIMRELALHAVRTLALFEEAVARLPLLLSVRLVLVLFPALAPGARPAEEGEGHLFPEPPRLFRLRVSGQRACRALVVGDGAVSLGIVNLTILVPGIGS